VESHRVGRYALVKLIGRGGMADVWIGKAFGASGFEKIVAIKLLAPYNVDKEDYQRALTDEARVLVHLKHPNIVDVYDLNFEAENPFLVMEYVEGTELRDILRALRAKKRILPLPLANYILVEVSKALSHAHERKDPQTGRALKIVHRDVSPSNILISSQGDVKLSDFGIAKSALQSGQTQVGLIKGKFRYMSPEQAEGRALDGRSDMFSLGLVYYECLFGEPAYDGSSDIGIFQRARTADVTIPECTPEIKRVLSKLLAPRPADRFTDLAAFRRAFMEGAAGRSEMGDREALAEFLETLDLPQLKKANEIRRQVENWDPQPTSQILTDRGTIQTLAEEIQKPRRWWRYGLGGGVAMASVLLLLALMRRTPAPGDVLPPETRPTTVSAARAVASPLPETQPETQPKAQGALAVEAAPKIPQIKDVRVRFVAEPYAAVTIPGFLSGIETPIATKSLPPGDYDVTFVHAPTGHRAVAKLRGHDGGSFLCSANMAVEDPAARPTASCRLH
jgi:serine/threonine protein kinase